MDVMWRADETARELGELLNGHRAGGVVALDLREFRGWTDFFIIATATSDTHSRGLEGHIREFARERDLEILGHSRRTGTGDEWHLIDLGPLVVHLMSPRARDFYELERLWGTAPVIYRGNQPAPEAPYSSKSS